MVNSPALGMDERIEVYLKALSRELERGRTTEHTHRPALKTLIESLGNVLATNEPGREQCGAPDYVVTKSGPITIGYIETKDIGKPLDEIERSEQIQRYRKSLPNLILTDYLQFRWYVNGEPRKLAAFAETGKNGKLVATDGSEALDLLKNFLAHAPQPLSTPKDLAERMARLTHLIRDVIVEAFVKQHASQSLKDCGKRSLAH